MDAVQTIALSLGSGWAAGINLYAAIASLGIMGASGGMQLPPNLQVLSHPVVITIAVVMFIVEFFADKVPGFDSIWDGIHTFIRIPAGAILASQAVGPIDPAWQIAAGLAGGTLAGATHATKAGTRLLINTSPEPFSNWAASITEDVLVIGAMWTVLYHPYIFIALLAVCMLFIAWFLPKVWKAVRSIFRWIAGGFRGKPEQSAPVSAGP